jgi:hypothetical protein
MTQDQAIDLWQQFAEQLRHIRTTEGDIHRDDSRIWDGYLHVWDNDHWIAVLTEVSELYKRYPEYFESYHIDTLKECAKVLSKNQSGHSRVLDTKHYKSLAWRASMMLDEVWNNVKIKEYSHRAKRDTKTMFEQLFDN